MSVAEAFALVLVAVGCSFYFAGTVGLLRFPDTMSRLHALTKADNAGLGFICLGLGCYDGHFISMMKLLLIWILALTSAAVSAFLLAGWAGDSPEDAK